MIDNDKVKLAQPEGKQPTLKEYIASKGFSTNDLPVDINDKTTWPDKRLKLYISPYTRSFKLSEGLS